MKYSIYYWAEYEIEAETEEEAIDKFSEMFDNGEIDETYIVINGYNVKT